MNLLSALHGIQADVPQGGSTNPGVIQFYAMPEYMALMIVLTRCASYT